ncbi:MAG: DUF128 domain-containing protein [Candidatus Altiarchaeota archaeon]|nr:DUF128 domain-containing protein [Candidatus Altiarchaeota archaeon]
MTKKRNIFEILSILERKNKALTSSEIARELQDIGTPLTERMIRNYLQELDGMGFTENMGREGRWITEEGRDELRTSFVYARSDYIVDKMARIMCDSKFDVYKQRGEVIVNLSFIAKNQEQEVRATLRDLCRSNLFPQMVGFAHSGEKICNRLVPDGMFGLATMSSATIDQLWLNYGIFMHIGVSLTVEVEDMKPIRCNNFVSPLSASIDTIELFMRSGLFHIRDIFTKNRGVILAEYNEIPYTMRTKAINLLKKALEAFGGMVIVSGGEGEILGLPTKTAYTGIITVCGECLPAALEEKGIKTNTETIAGAINFRELEPVAPVQGEVLLL